MHVTLVARTQSSSRPDRLLCRFQRSLDRLESSSEVPLAAVVFELRLKILAVLVAGRLKRIFIIHKVEAGARLFGVAAPGRVKGTAKLSTRAARHRSGSFARVPNWSFCLRRSFLVRSEGPRARTTFGQKRVCVQDSNSGLLLPRRLWNRCF